MFCYKCGKEISDNAKFCSKCGTPQKITEIAPPPQENTEPTPAPVPEPTPAPEPTPVPEPISVPATEPTPTPEPISVSAPAPVPAPAPQIIVNPIMLKLKTPYYWISKVCLALVAFCFFLPFVSGMDIERFLKDTSYSGFKLIQLTIDDPDPNYKFQIYIFGFLLLFLLIISTYAIVSKSSAAVKGILIGIICFYATCLALSVFNSIGYIADIEWLLISLSLWGMVCSVLLAVLFHKAQRFYEFTGIIFTIGMILILDKNEADVIYNLVEYEVSFSLYIIIGLFVLAFIFATADKHVVKAQKKLEKQQESMTNTNQYQQL